MIYVDPPYGVKFGSNFQPFVRNRTVSDAGDEDMTREPEMVKAYRDTWELGLHSYLTYLRDRLAVARELLTQSGSVFVQISEDNLHLVRNVLDETFGPANFVVCIAVKKTGSQRGSLIQSVTDYVLWYAKDKPACVSYASKLFVPLSLIEQIDDGFNIVELGPRKDVPLNSLLRPGEQRETGVLRIFEENRAARLFASNPLTSGGYRKNQSLKFSYQGREFDPGIARGSCWKHTVRTDDGSTPGMQRLADAGRLYVARNQLRFKRYSDDFPFKELTNLWDGLGGASNPIYVVQTNLEIVSRCILMTTKPGDIVLDPTCGSGTTAYVAEKWGRRWITIDTSRVPLALARQRLLTATYPYFALKSPSDGPSSGFIYQERSDSKGRPIGGIVRHITSSTIANDEPPAMDVLVDRPEVTSKVTRVSGPFVVEAIIAPVQPLDDTRQVGRTQTEAATEIDRMIEVLRQSKTLQPPGNRRLTLSAVHRTTDTEYLHAEAVDGDHRVAVVFGPEDGAISSIMVYEAAREAHFLKYNRLYFFGFAIQANAREMIEDAKQLRIPASYVAVTPDVAMADLLKTTRASEIFSITGLPDFEIRRAKKKGRGVAPLHEVELLGLDIFNPETLETESVAGQNVPCWMLDTDYDGMCFYATQVFFPKTGAWDDLEDSLKASFEDSVWDHLAGTISEPFALGERRRVAVKVIDERGNELLRVREFEA
jgi:adenine-specific DNA-methyltransferase